MFVYFKINVEISFSLIYAHWWQRRAVWSHAIVPSSFVPKHCFSSDYFIQIPVIFCQFNLNTLCPLLSQTLRFILNFHTFKSNPPASPPPQIMCRSTTLAYICLKILFELLKFCLIFFGLGWGCLFFILWLLLCYVLKRNSIR